MQEEAARRAREREEKERKGRKQHTHINIEKNMSEPNRVVVYSKFSEVRALV